MIGKRGVVVSVLTGFVLCAASCGPKREPTMDANVRAGDDMPKAQTGEARIERLGEAINEFAAARKGLHGHADEQSRRDLAEALAKLQDVLALLRGPEPTGAFRQQMRIIESGRTRLTSASATAPEPTINAAIRAAQNALADIASDQFGDDEETTKLLTALRPRVEELDTVRGPLHGFVAAQALDEIGKVAGRMADVLRQRLPQEQPATAPATNPA